MATMDDKIFEAKKIEDYCNVLRDEMSQLQYQKRMLERQKKDTNEISMEIASLSRVLEPSWEKFEVLLDEIGSDNYYNYLKEIKFKEMNNNDWY